MSIQASSISWEIDGKKIINNVSLEINHGEVVSIIGPNGAGKSSFLNVLSGDIKPTAGDITFDNVDLKEITIQERSFMRSVMSQSQQIVYDFSVKEIIEMGWLDRGIASYSEDFKYAVMNAAEECSILDILDQKFNTLSGGEQRRVHFARTLIQLWRPSDSKDPRYMFLDEPTANLDIKHEQNLMKLVKEKANEGIGVLLILHDLNLAARYSDKLFIFKEGNLIKSGPPEEVLDKDMLTDVYGLEMNVEKDPLRVNYY
tara:strand:- start:1265 stop:2038 length:774 start_codon:yes stop_codon:yes gene_type:complete